MTQFEVRPADWLAVGEALQRVVASANPLGAEETSLDESLGRALAEPVSAGAKLPPWDNSAMDGYAIRHQDLDGASPDSPVVLRVVEGIRAGEQSARKLAEGEAIRIMTGAPVPPGADAVVRVEDTDAEEKAGFVAVFASSEAGKDVRPGGQDMVAGEEVLPVGTSIGPGQIGLLYATGSRRVRVHRKPRVAILSTGDEIADLDDFVEVRRGRAIPETNSPTLAAAVAGIGGVPLRLGIAKDTAESIVEKVARARSEGADVLLTSGGASMGEHDLIKRVLDDLGFELDFWRVRMRPGTPFSFGTLPRLKETSPLPVFGLPGNPASSFVTFQVFCRPYLLKLAGHRRIHRPVLLATAGEDFRSPAHLTHFFRVTLSGDPARPVARSTGPQTSGLVRGQGLAQALAVVPEGRKLLEEGERVRVILLDDAGQGGGQPGFLPS